LFDKNATVEQKVNIIMNKLDLPNDMAGDFLEIVHTEVVVVADDSGSMMGSRWGELQAGLAALADLLVMIDDGNGFELKFLNSRPPSGGTSVQVHNSNDLTQIWNWARPQGRTPLCDTVRPYMSAAGMAAHTRLVLVFTDGEPNQGYQALAQVIRSKTHGKVGVGFMMCTTDDNVVEHYNQHFDKGIPGVDVNDDYESEKREAQQHGKQLPYNLYLVKAMLGPLHEKYDKMDETPTYGRTTGGGGYHQSTRKTDGNNGSCVLS